jgi:4-amino-4-deoxy-L-arabinose transferase-like glycosyltransferase
VTRVLLKSIENKNAPDIVATGRFGRAKSVIHKLVNWDQKFWFFLGTITLIGLAGRIVFVALVKWHQQYWADGLWYWCAAQGIAQGKFLTQAFAAHYPHSNLYFPCLISKLPTAIHPPAYPVLLAIFRLLGIKTLGATLVLNCIINAAIIPLTGILARRVFNAAAGLIAGFFAAAYPGVWLVAGQLTSEGLCTIFCLLAVYYTYRLYESLKIIDAILVGVFAALAALTRPEYILLAPILLIPLFYKRSHISIKNAIKSGALILLTLVILMAPWSLRNTLDFGWQNALTTVLGEAVQSANCNTTYYAPAHPNPHSYSGEGFQMVCANVAYLTGNEGQQQDTLLTEGTSYIKTHLSRLPVVVIMRIGRTWEFFYPFGSAKQDDILEIWYYPADIVKVIIFYPLALFALIGIILLNRRRQIYILPLLAVPIIVTLAVAIAGYDPRYRVMAEPFICMLAAVGILGLHSKLARLKKSATKNDLSL